MDVVVGGIGIFALLDRVGAHTIWTDLDRDFVQKY